MCCGRQPTKILKYLLYTNIRAFRFRGSPSPQKYFNNEHFPNYSIITFSKLRYYLCKFFKYWKCSLYGLHLNLSLCILGATILIIPLFLFKHKCYIVATCDRDLKRRIRKIPGVPIMYITRRQYSIERMPDAFGGMLVMIWLFVLLTTAFHPLPISSQDIGQEFST